MHLILHNHIGYLKDCALLYFLPRLRDHHEWSGMPIYCTSMQYPSSYILLMSLMALTLHSDCRSSAGKPVGPFVSWPIQRVQSAEKNPDAGLEDGQSHSTHRKDSGHRSHQTVLRRFIWLVCQGLYTQ